jgi:hypothetical protein
VLENLEKSSIINVEKGQKKPYTKIKAEDIPPMDTNRFNIMKKGLEKNGIAVIQDSDGDDYLKGMGAEAITLSDGSAVIFQSGRVPSASAAFEEIIHTTQIRTNGMVDLTIESQSAIEYCKREIEANEKLLKYKKAYGLTPEDIESVSENLEKYYKLLEKVKSGV